MKLVEMRISDRRVLKLVLVDLTEFHSGVPGALVVGPAAQHGGKGRNLRAGEASRWAHDFFHAHGLSRRRGTIKYPEAA